MFFSDDGLSNDDLTADERFLQKSDESQPPHVGINSGDPYRDTTDPLRGMPMSHLGWPVSDHFGKRSNDPYSDDDAVRGCTMVHAPGHDSLFSKGMDDSMEGCFFGSFVPPLPSNNLSRTPSKDDPYRSINGPPQLEGSQRLEGSQQPSRFQQDDMPPVRPSRHCFQYGATTMFITTPYVQKFANTIIDFFDSQVLACNLKIKSVKYTIKVVMFMEHIMCTLKIRFWRETSKQNHYAIEFQRRSGDCWAFGSGYRQCLEFIAVKFPDVSAASMNEETGKAPALPSLPPSEDRSDEELSVELFSLLDMAAMEECSTLQVEAASALAKLACEDVYVAKYLSKADVLDQLLPLFSSDALDIMYPASRMLSAVAMNAITSIADHSIFKVSINKIAHPKSNQLVRLELAKAVSAAFHNGAYLLVAAQLQGLRELIESTMKSLTNEPGMSVVVTTLQDVLLEMNSYAI